jgi:hypothetical protein
MKTFSHFHKKRLLLLALLLGAGGISAFPLWLDQPRRSNRFDPKSTLFRATPAPVPTNTITPTFSATPSFTPYAGTATSTFTATPVPAGILFEDFESATPLSPAPYGSLETPASSWDNSNSVSATHSWHINTSSSGWGAGINIGSNYGIINATGALTLDFWMKADTGATFTVRFRENGNPVTFDDENWMSTTQSIVGNSTWTHYSLSISTFIEDINADAGCAPTCNGVGKGNNSMDLGVINKFEIQFTGGLTNANFYLDDISFGLAPPATPTPTASPTPYAGSPTSTFTPLPYTGAPFPGPTDPDIPGRIEAENYDAGGTGVAYGGLGCPSSGTSSYRSPDCVGIETTTDTGGGYNVGWTAVGQWMKYSVNATMASASYTLTVRVACNGVGGTFHVTMDGSDISGILSIPDTGGWQVWQTLTVSGISLSTGNHLMELVVDSSGAGGVGNFNWFQFDVPGTPTPTVIPTATYTACAPTGNFGMTTLGAFLVNNPGPDPYPNTSWFVLGSPVTAESISGYVGSSAAGLIQFMIYDDSSGKPNNLVAATVPFAPSVNAWNTVAITPTSLPAGTYWLGWQANSAGTGLIYDAPSANCCSYNTYSACTFGSPPSPYPSGTTSSFRYSIYVNYCP